MFYHCKVRSLHTRHEHCRSAYNANVCSVKARYTAMFSLLVKKNNKVSKKIEKPVGAMSEQTKEATKRDAGKAGKPAIALANTLVCASFQQSFIYPSCTPQLQGMGRSLTSQFLSNFFFFLSGRFFCKQNKLLLCYLHRFLITRILYGSEVTHGGNA